MRPAQDRSASFIRTARREQIVSCAIEVIAEVGYPQASIRRIADRVGIAMSAVLYHFGSKDKLVEAIVEHMYRMMLAWVTPAVDAQSSAAAKLNAYIRSSIEYFGTHRAALLALASLATSFIPGDGRRFDELGMSSEIAEQLAALDPASILAAGQRDGEFHEFPVESTAMALRGAINAVVDQILRERDYDAAGYGDDLVDIFGRIVRRTP